MRRRITIFFVIFFLALVGCDTQIAPNDADPATTYPVDAPIATIAPLPAPEITADVTEKDDEDHYRMGKIPLLPIYADDIASFVPDDWILFDHAELDYNADGFIDVVGILHHPFDEDNCWYPRILFAALQTSDEKYVLDFQDINLVRGEREGGVFGDPYLPMTAEGNTFTINTYGGSAWKWSESTTFEYRNGDWYLSQEKSRYGYGSVTTDVSFNDYRTGIGIRRLNNDDFENIEVLSHDVEERFELEYEVKLDSAPTLNQASQRWWLARERLTTIPAKEIQISAHIDLEKADVPLWYDKGLAFTIQYTDETYILYTFRKNENVYIAICNRDTQTVNVISQAEQGGDIGAVLSEYFHSLVVYREKIYYSENVQTTAMIKRNDEIVETDEILCTRVLRMNLDGDGVEVLFQYDNDYSEGKVLDTYLPYISATPYPSGGELIISLFIGNAPNKYYRMNLDGSSVQFIGELKGFYN